MVPVPHAADIAACLEGRNPETHFAEFIHGVQAAESGADDDDVQTLSPHISVVHVGISSIWCLDR